MNVVLYILILLLGLTIQFISTIAALIIVYKDATKRNKNPMLWVILTIFFNFIALIFYLVLISLDSKNSSEKAEIIDVRSNEIKVPAYKNKVPRYLIFHIIYSVVFSVTIVYLSVIASINLFLYIFS